jgi:hypothetical protein
VHAVMRAYALPSGRGRTGRRLSRKPNFRGLQRPRIRPVNLIPVRAHRASARRRPFLRDELLRAPLKFLRGGD